MFASFCQDAACALLLGAIMLVCIGVGYGLCLFHQNQIVRVAVPTEPEGENAAACPYPNRPPLQLH